MSEVLVGDAVPVTTRYASEALDFRVRPRLWHAHYLALRSNLIVLRDFRDRVQAGNSMSRILDLGCGYKPFLPLFQQSTVIGSDFTAVEATPDVIATNTQLPFADTSFDACIASETLEHTEAYELAIAEMIRVTRPGGLLYISVPFVHPMHHHPYDYQRITEYRFAHLFHDHEMLVFRPSNTVFSTWLVALNYAIAVGVQPLPLALRASVAAPLMIFNNVLAASIDWGVNHAARVADRVARRKLVARMRHPRGLTGVLTGMPIGYAMIVRVRVYRAQ